MSDNDQITATIVADDALSAEVQSISQNLESSLDSEGNLVVQKFQIDPSNFTLSNLTNVSSDAPADGSYLYYDNSTSLWKPSSTSLSQTILDEQAEKWTFDRQYGFFLGSGGGKDMPAQPADFIEFDFSIPASANGSSRKRKVNVEFTYHIFVNGQISGTANQFPTFEVLEQIVYEHDTSPVSQHTVESTISDPASSFSAGKQLIFDGDLTQVFSRSGGIKILGSISYAGQIFALTSIYYRNGKTYVGILDFSDIFQAGTTIYYSPSRFATLTFGNAETVAESFVKTHQLESIQPSSQAETFFNGHAFETLETVLPPSSTETNVTVRTRCTKNPGDSSGGGVNTAFVGLNRIRVNVENYK